MLKYQFSRRTILLSETLLFAILLFELCGDIPVQYLRNYSPGAAITYVPIQTNDSRPQLGYFKEQPEWDWDVPPRSKYSSYGPKNKDVVVLTASDGGGHNSAIPNILERVLNDREDYCAKHGYTQLWLNTSRYDIGPAHRTWSKIPAVAEAFYLYPQAEWVWLMDTDILIMDDTYDLVSSILSHTALTDNLLRNATIYDGEHNLNTNITTHPDPTISEIDILITQDHQSVNTGSTFFRRSVFTRYILEIMMDDELFMGQEHMGAEQDALKHLMLQHKLVRDHVGLFPQRQFNAYAQGGDNMGYRDGDLLVHLAGCWTGGKCEEWFDLFWERRGKKEAWRPEGGEITGL